MKKQHVWPKGHWNWPIDIVHKHGVRCGDMVWVGGQVNLSPQGEVLNPGDLSNQTRNVITNIEQVLEELDCVLTDIVNLNCFYVNDGSQDEAAFLGLIADALPNGTRTTITPIPVPYLAYENMLVEIEAVAMRGMNGQAMVRQYSDDDNTFYGSEKFCRAVRCGKMIYLSAHSPVDKDNNVLAAGNIVEQAKIIMQNIGQTLAGFGADFSDVVKLNRWYAGNVGIDDFEPAALATASFFSEPGPAATGVPIPRHANPDILNRIAMIAMLGENGECLPRKHVWPEPLWDWHVHLPYKHGLECEGMIFLGGQVSLDKQGGAVHPGDLSAQTHQAMKHIGTILKELGAGYDDVCKVMTVYSGNCGAEALNANLPIRSSYFSDPGPATTGVPLPALAYEAMDIEIDIYAMKGAD